ncbi:23S rRNA (guanosine-2'-O-)-methyltransferase rlmB [Escherichia coli]|uniref:23S rRNA (Guanosine-2'-O-)-methyltransferase rlmB n=1 Tax=Escherichia coli TaxID=562 RepID=A0A2X3K5J1_ECOLX|nr:23S rRNA (guanosine-2'-O-)-methyltransferase rlmB [Escherichia coli]
MRMLQEENIWIVGTAGEADHTLYQSKMTGRLALVMGAEGEGMRRLTREHCDEFDQHPNGRKCFFPERFGCNRNLLI